MSKKPYRDQAHFRVGDAMAYPDRSVILIHDQEHSVEPRVMEVLIALVTAAQENEVLSAVDLYIRVWMGGPTPTHDHVGGAQAENPVHKAITCLRKIFADDLKSPQYIETIRKRGYRLVARVVYQDHSRRVIVPRKKTWTKGSPYVGLNAFDSEHSSVFLGRSRTTSELVTAMRRQIDQQRRLVLVVGASGCGKTSVLNAGAIPMVTEDGGYAGLCALSVARCDLAGTRPDDALPRLAAALMQWTLGAREIFAPQPLETLVESLRARIDSISETLEDAFRRHASRELSALTHPHVLLVIDHAEALVADPSYGGDSHSEIDRFLHHLCESRHVCVIMIVRGDFYLALAEALPRMTERKSGDGHVDVLTPRSGEIAEIIRTPAAAAGLEFEQHPESGDHLDDILLRATASQPDALPLLQHTLQMLYERRNEKKQLCFDAYYEIGELEGALAHHAEEIFNALPRDIQKSLGELLSRMVVMQPEDDRISARRIPRWTLNPPTIMLAESFVQARLFVAEHENGSAHYRVAHEALLRRWPRVAEWTRENRRILLARIRLHRAAARWAEEGKRNDHLLNPGAPLEEALEIERREHRDLSQEEREFVENSRAEETKKRLLKNAAIALLTLLAFASTASSIMAMKSTEEAESRKEKGIALVGYMLDELSDQLRPSASIQALDSISMQSLSYLESEPFSSMSQDEMINYSRALRTRGEILSSAGQSEEATTAFKKSKEVAMNAYLMNTESPDAQFELGQTEFWLGAQNRLSGNYDDARRHWSSYESIAATLANKPFPRPEWTMEFGFASANMAVLDLEADNCNEAIAKFQPSIESMSESISRKPKKTIWRYDQIVARSWLSRCLTKNGRTTEAYEQYLTQIVDLQSIIKENPNAIEWIQQLSSIEHIAAISAIDLGRTVEARKLMLSSLSNLQLSTTLQPSKLQWKRNMASAWMKLGDINLIIDKKSDAIHAYKKTSTACNTWKGTMPSLSWRQLCASVSLRISFMERNLIEFESPIETLQKIKHENPGNENATIALAQALISKGKMLHSIGEHAKATAAYRQAELYIQEKAKKTKDPRILAPWLEAAILSASTDPLIAKAIDQLRSSCFANPEYPSVIQKLKKSRPQAHTLTICRD